MSRTLDIPARERGMVRLFTVDLPEAELHTLAAPDAASRDAFADNPRPYPPAAAPLLGADAIDTAHAELFDLHDLEGLGLAGYLAEAFDISRDQLAPHRAMLDALKGFVLVLPSEATPGGAQLTLVPGVHLVALFETPKAAVSMKRLTSETGRGWGGGAAVPAPTPAHAFPIRALAIAVVILSAIALWLWLTLG